MTVSLVKPADVFREFWERYSGKRLVLGQALFNHDPYDQFAWCQEWRFAICDYLVWELGGHVPGFRPACGPDDDSYAYDCLRHMNVTEESLRYALRILDRFGEWLRIEGKDY